MRNGWREDVYVTLIAAPANGRIVVGMRVNPLVIWLWIDTGIMVGATALAAWPAPHHRRRPGADDLAAVTSPAPVPPAPELAAAGGAL